MVLFSFGVLSHPKTVHAGTNGQQLDFECGPSLGDVAVTGHNQNGDLVTWRGRSDNGYSISTTGWWWVGWVTVDYVEGGVLYSQQVHVPKVWSTDWWVAECKR
jgi:hypothetical protein